MSEFIDNRGDLNVRSVGPFESWPVVVDGWTVPNLQARYTDQGVSVTLDDRFGLDLPTEIAAAVLRFTANAIAVALGWSCHPTSVDWEPPSGFRDGSGAPARLLPWKRLTGIVSDPEAGE